VDHHDGEFTFGKRAVGAPPPGPAPRRTR
jgi:hypothetical protein